MPWAKPHSSRAELGCNSPGLKSCRSQQAAIHRTPKQTRAPVSHTSSCSVPFGEHIFIIFSEILPDFKSPAQSSTLFSVPTGRIFAQGTLSLRKPRHPFSSKYCAYCRSCLPLAARKQWLFHQHHCQNCTTASKSNYSSPFPPLTLSMLDPRGEAAGLKPSELCLGVTDSTFNTAVKLGNAISYFVFWN